MNQRTIPTLLAVTALLAACGGSDGGVSTAVSNTSAVAPADDTPTASEAAESDGDSSGTAQDDSAQDDFEQDDSTGGDEAGGDAGDQPGGDDTVDSEVDVSFDGSGSDEFCGWAADVNERFDEIDQDPFEFFTEDGMNELLDVLNEMSARAPDEIEADVDATVAAFEELRALFAEYDYDVLTAVTENEALFDDLDDRYDFEEASDRVDRYIEDVCGITDPDDAVESPVDVPIDTALDVDLSGSDAEIFADVMASTFGLDEEQRQCFIDNIDPETLSGAVSGDVDPMAFLDVLTTCGVSLTDLAGG